MVVLFLFCDRWFICVCAGCTISELESKLLQSAMKSEPVTCVLGCIHTKPGAAPKPCRGVRRLCGGKAVVSRREPDPLRDVESCGSLCCVVVGSQRDAKGSDCGE